MHAPVQEWVGVANEDYDAEAVMFKSTLTESYMEARYPRDRVELSVRCDRDFAGAIPEDTREASY